MQNPIRQPNLTWRLRWWFIGISLVPLVSLLLFVHSASEWVLHQEVTARIGAVADSKADELETFAKEHLSDLKRLAETLRVTQSVQQLVLHDPADSETFDELAAQMREHLAKVVHEERYADVLVVSNAGVELFAYSGTHAPGADYRADAYRGSQLAAVFEQVRATQQPAVSAFAPSFYSGEPALLFAAPVTLDDAQLGVLIAEIHHRSIHRMLRPLGGKHPTGEFIAGQLGDHAVTFIAPTRHTADQEFAQTVPLDDPLAQSLQRAASGHRGSGILIDHREQEFYSAWRHLPTLNWGLAVEVELQEVFAPMNRVRLWTFLLTLTIAATSFVLAWYVAASLARPIADLTAATQMVAAGQLEVRVPTDRTDELGGLARAFNAMTNDLQQLHQTLEQQVQDRTRQLSEHQERFRELVSSIRETFWYAKAGSIEILYISPAYETIWGRSCESVYESPQSWLDAVHPEDRQRIQIIMETGCTRGLPWESEYRVVRPSGEVRWVRERVSIILGEDGQASRIAGITEDVTERKQADEEYSQFFNQSQDLLAIAGYDGFIKKVNPAMQQASGYGLEDLYKSPFISFIHPDDHQRALQEIQQGRQRGGTKDFELRICRPDGSIRHLSVNSTTSRQNEVFYLIGEDITERLQFEQKLAELDRFARSTLDALSNHIAILDEQGQVLSTNRAWQEFADATQSAAEMGVGTNYLAACERDAGYCGAKGTEMAQGIRRVIAGELSEFTQEYACEVTDNQCWFLARATRFHDGGPVRVVLSHENITAAKVAGEERQKFFALVENSLDFIGMATLSGDVFYLNPAAAQLVGATPEHPTHHGTVMDHLTESSRHRFETTVLPALMTDGQWAGELQFRCLQSGRAIDMHSSVFLVRDPVSQEPICIATVSHDITERKRRDDELLQARAQLLDAIESLDAGLVMYDEHEKLVICNGKYKEYYAPAAHRLVPGADLEETLRAPFRTGSSQHGGMSEEQWVSERLAAHRNPGAATEQLVLGRWIRSNDRRTSSGGIVSLRTDITALKQLQQEAEAANQAKSEFLANISHEIRTPMNGVIGLTQLALETPLSAEQRQYLEGIRRSGNSLLQLLNDILDFSKIEAGELTVDSIEFNLRSAVENAVKTTALQAHQKGLELLCDIPAEVPETLIGDPARLRQVLINLVGNAVKFTTVGEVAIVIEPQKITADAVWLRFSVNDTGIGIAADRQQAIFEAFTQADGSTTRNFGGSGLGLTISQQLVQLMGGAMRVESELGVGSHFEFTLEFRRAPATSLPTASPLPAVSLAGTRVLVVDDNATNRQILLRTLQRWGVHATEADSGAAVLDLLRAASQSECPFEVILMDVAMPEMDGFMVLEQIQSDPSIARPAILMLSSIDRRADIARARELSAAAYLVKPILADELHDAIQHVLTQETLEEEPVEASSPAVVIFEKPVTRRRRVLVAEDNAVNQLFARRTLERAGHDVAVADNGEQVLELLDQQAFDVVLMDVQMPIMDGFQATKRIREREPGTGRHQPIIAMTAHAMKGDREQCLAAGMDDYVSKPIDSTLLFAAIDAACAAAEREPDTLAVAASKPAAASSPEPWADEPEFLQELANMFLEDYPHLMSDIRQSIDQADGDELKLAAHTLKGSAGVFKDQAAYDAALALELIGRDAAWECAEQAWDTLQAEITRLSQRLTALLTSSGDNTGAPVGPQSGQRAADETET